MRLRDCIAAIEHVANPACQASWDRSGLQVAAERLDVRHLGVCLDPLPATIAAALAAGCDLILSHHPLSLKPSLPNELDNWHASLKLLLCADVPLYAAHTSLDVNLDGPAGWLGRELGLTDTKPLEPTGESGSGFGQVGNLPQAMPRDAFVRELLVMLSLDCAQACGAGLPDQIHRVAWCGGSGGSLLQAAAREGADIYITGDIKHHTALDAAGLHVAVLDVGHHSLEEEMMRRFAHYLRETLPEVMVKFLPCPAPFRLVCQP